MSKKSDRPYIDLTKTYILPMILKGQEYPNEIEDVVECKARLSYGGCIFSAIQEGYLDKCFYDVYVIHLIDTGYIKIKE